MSESAAAPLFELKGIVHFYGARKVLDIQHLVVEPGKIYGLVGPNGSGKSTLLYILNLLLTPTKGEIYFEGDIVHPDGLRRHVVQRSMTMLLQRVYLFSGTVEQNVEYGLKVRGVPKRSRQQRVRDVLRGMGLEGMEGRSTSQLSGGEEQLVALARAVVLGPRVLLLDEPTTNVDVKHVRQLESLIVQINRENATTIIVTTHDLSQAYRLADEVFSLFDGNLVGSTMHNLYTGRIQKFEHGTFFHTGKISVQLPDGDYDFDGRAIAVDPEDIIVSKVPVVSSARNSFPGLVTQIRQQGGTVQLEVASGELFQVQITTQSFRDLQLTLGSRVYATFKSSSVRIL